MRQFREWAAAGKWTWLLLLAMLGLIVWLPAHAGAASPPSGDDTSEDADATATATATATPSSLMADRVYGQPGLTTSRTDSGLSANSLSQATGVAADAAGGLYAVDSYNNRVLHYPAGSTTADRVYGQSTFTVGASNNGGLSAASLSSPLGAAVDAAGGLYVADSGNNRVLHYPSGSTTADVVYGQPAFITNSQNGGGLNSAAGLNYPAGVAVDSGGGLYVVDEYNHRVVHYPAGSTSMDRVYGQPGFTSNSANAGGISAASLNYPTGVTVDPSGGLYVADDYNQRVLHYPVGSTTADRVYGQPGFTTNTANDAGGVSAASLFYPVGVAVDRSGGLYVADSNNQRVLHYPAGSTSADRAYGQPDTSTNTQNSLSAASLSYPAGVGLDASGGLYVADGNNSRVLHYAAGSTTADRVYGQPGPTANVPNTASPSATNLNGPAGVVMDASGGLYVADSNNHRVLHYPAGSATADRVYGQPTVSANDQNSGGISATSLSFPSGIAVDTRGGLYVADSGNHRVLHYPAGSTTADRVYGQPDLTSGVANNGGVGATSLYAPGGVAMDAAGGLYVADSGNNRVLHYPAGNTTADRVYGQPGFTTNTANGAGVTASSLYQPQGVAVDASGGLYVADKYNQRVLHYPAGSTTADRVYGQTALTTNAFNSGGTGAASATSLAFPSGVVVDSSGGLYVADADNHRVLHYPVGSTSADRVYGQVDVVSGIANQGGPVSAGGLSSPMSAAVDAAGGLYVADFGNNRVLHYPPYVAPPPVPPTPTPTPSPDS